MTLEDNQQQQMVCLATRSGNIHNVRYEHKIFKVYSKAGDHRGCACAVKIQPFTCVVFSKDLDSWLAEGSTVRRLRADEWAVWITAADPVKSHSIIYTPEKLSEDLLQEHPGLDILTENQLKQLSEEVLIFSRSWAVELI